MPHQFIFKDTETGRELVLPVTPKGYDIEHGRKANSISMQQVGDVNLPGLPVLLDTELECLLPAQAYPFLQPGRGPTHGSTWSSLRSGATLGRCSALWCPERRSTRR